MSTTASTCYPTLSMQESCQRDTPGCGGWLTENRTELRPRRTIVVRTNRSQAMDMNNFFNDLQGKIHQAIENSPAKDLEKNIKSMMQQGFSRLDLVTREEVAIQAQVQA